MNLEVFSRPEVIENSRQFFLPQTDILRKTVVGCSWKLVVMAIPI